MFNNTACNHLGQSGPLDEIVELSERRVAGQGLQVRKQVLLLCLKQPSVDVVPETKLHT